MLFLLILSFFSMRRKRVDLLHLDGILLWSIAAKPQKFVELYPEWVGRGTAIVKCPAYEHHTNIRTGHNTDTESPEW